MFGQDGGVTPAADSPSPPASPGREIELEASNGEAVLSLGETPTSGYLWRVVDLPPAVELVASEFQGPESGLVGGRGERRFTLRAHDMGTYRFAAELGRAWESTVNDRIQVTLNARQPWLGPMSD
jgi:predicted secreted protein